MPYCPKCGYDYQPGYAVCPDCNSPLAERPPAPVLPPLNKRLAVEFTIIITLAPWLYYGLLAAVQGVVDRMDKSGLPREFSFLFPLVPVLGAVIVYGYRRHVPLNGKLISWSLPICAVVQLLVWIAVLASGSGPDGFGVLLGYLAALYVSGAALGAALAGSYLLKYKHRPNREMGE